MAVLSYTDCLLMVNTLEAKIEKLAREKEEMRDYVVNLLMPGGGSIFEDATKQVLYDQFNAWVKKQDDTIT